MKISSKTIFFIIVLIILLFIGIGSCDDNKNDDPWTNFDGSEIVCRRSGCGKKPVYSDWDRRFCSKHIQEDHYCRYPGCTNRISNSSTGRYCYEHK